MLLPLHATTQMPGLQNTLLEQQEKNKSLENVKEVLEGNIGSLNTKLRLSEQQIQALNEEVYTTDNANL